MIHGPGAYSDVCSSGHCLEGLPAQPTTRSCVQRTWTSSSKAVARVCLLRSFTARMISDTMLATICGE